MAIEEHGDPERREDGEAAEPESAGHSGPAASRATAKTDESFGEAESATESNADLDAEAAPDEAADTHTDADTDEPWAADSESDMTDPGDTDADDRASDAAGEADAEPQAAETPVAGGDAAAAGGSGSVKRILEAALLVAGRPLSLNDFEKLFGGSAEAPPRNAIRGALAELAEDWHGRSLDLQEVATGYRAQVRTEFEPWIARLWDEKPPRYSRALLETLAIIAYRQPMTRSEIEDIRGVSVSSQIIRTLTEREWIRVVGHREAPGRPAMYGTTREFLDYFNLKTLDQLPPISDIKDLEGQYPELGFEAEPAARKEGGAAEAEVAGEGGGEGDTGSAGASAESGGGASANESDTAEGPAQDPAGREPEATPSPGAAPTDGDDEVSGHDDAEEGPCTPAS